MFGQSRDRTIGLGHILKVPIRLDLSWFLIFALVTWSLATTIFPEQFADWPTARYWIVAAVTSVLLFVSVLLHELGHSIVAIRRGVAVRRITLFIFGGVADLGSEPQTAQDELFIAAAGPLVSLLLGGVFYGLSLLLGASETASALLRYLGLINVSLAAFNLIPGFPLDGGRVLRGIVWGINHDFDKATRVSASVGRVIGYGLIGLGVVQMGFGDFVNGLWTAFIGWFLESAAGQHIQVQKLQDRLAGLSVAQAMSRNYAFIPADMMLQELVDHQILGSGRRTFIVRREEQPVGLLTMHQLQAVDRDQWAATRADAAMIPLTESQHVSPDTDLWQALQLMGRDGVNQLPVMAEGNVRGMLTREDIINALRAPRQPGP